MNSAEALSSDGAAEVEKWKKGSSEASDEQKTGKNSFLRPRMNRKQEKMAFRGLG